MEKISRQTLKKIVCEVLQEMQAEQVPIGISNRHIHLTEEHFSTLFPNETIKPLKMLKQPGEYAAEQTLTVIGPRGIQEKVRILGPLRKRTQVELSKTDARVLGIPAPIRLSGHLEDAAEITLKSEQGTLTVPAAIIAKRHIHLNFEEMARLGLEVDQLVSVKITTPERTTVFEDVALRPGEKFVMEMHIDTDEANAANVSLETTGVIII